MEEYEITPEVLEMMQTEGCLKDIKIDLRKLKNSEASNYYKELCELHPDILKMRETPRWLGPIGYPNYLITRYGELYNLKNKYLSNIFGEKNRKIINLWHNGKVKRYGAASFIIKIFGGAIDKVPEDSKRNLRFLGYPDYTITKSGMIWSHISCRWMGARVSRRGYVYVLLTNSGKTKHCTVHRLVAKAFIPNLYNKPQVNHINGDKTCNEDWNLEWMTNLENFKHAQATGLTDPNKTFSSDDKIHEVCRLISKGAKNREIAKITKVSAQVIGKIREGKNHVAISRHYHFPKPKTIRKQYTKEEILAAIQHMVEGKLNDHEITAATGVRVDTVRQIRKGKKYTHLTKDLDIQPSPGQHGTLPIATIRTICKRLQDGTPVRVLARELSIARSTIQNIYYRTHHRDISKDYVWPKELVA